MNARDQSWKLDASCRDLPTAVFFPEPTDVVGNARAVAVCDACPVREECLRFATVNRERYGVWGGRTEQDRNRRKQMPCAGDCGAVLAGRTPQARFCEDCRRKARAEATRRWRYAPA